LLVGGDAIRIMHFRETVVAHRKMHLGKHHHFPRTWRLKRAVRRHADGKSNISVCRLAIGVRDEVENCLRFNEWLAAEEGQLERSAASDRLHRAVDRFQPHCARHRSAQFLAGVAIGATKITRMVDDKREPESLVHR
jgi:hypothetical protein